jgi:CheY-like chemotaxis protein
MAISRELILLMKGHIAVHSEKGKGTTITLELTLALAEKQAEKISQKNPDAHLKGMKVLLVEDNDFNLAVASRSLKRFGCVVTEARNGRLAVDLLENGEKFDVVLMDMQMPVLDGIAATRIIRTELKDQVPIIALTANAFKAEVESCRAAGMNDYIAKPYEESVLFEVLSLYRPGAPEKLNVAGDNEATYDLRTLRELSNGEESFVKEMIQLFIDQALKASGEIKTAFEENDFKTVAASAHRMKASIDSLAIMALREPIRELESSALAGAPSKAALLSLVERVTYLLEHVAEKLKVKELS